jgi:hypothetical protein
LASDDIATLGHGYGHGRSERPDAEYNRGCAYGTSTRREESVERLRAACLFFVFLILSACGSPAHSGTSVEFGNTHNTRYLTAGTYAVAVANDCGVVDATVAGNIEGEGWSEPLLNGGPVTLPTSDDYTVVDPIGSDLMVNTRPCTFSLTVLLTRMKP